ncbi:hypothetical protein [Proteiniphilum sp. X52]|uniref:hypothetical protein n=1 Tax=Proteiniphilum sp. X52 TaxID=2382159 RepID=UPI000F0A5A94|nr:hypothetical protein [Proteiniphilum sp. X52]RNC64179.1 hypothetical protein D7D25_12435 [Proteiniphilum sp. X52]
MGFIIENREQNSYPSQLQRFLGNGYVVADFGKSDATLLAKGHHPYVKEPEYQETKRFAKNSKQLLITLGQYFAGALFLFKTFVGR